LTAFSQRSARIDPVEYAPNDARFAVSDFIGTIDSTATRKRLTRAITDDVSSGFEKTAPGAQHAFSVNSVQIEIVVVKLRYNGLVVRNDVYNDVGSVLVNGNVARTFTCCIAKVAGAPPAFEARVSVAVPAGDSIVRVVLPYCAGVDFEGLELPEGVTLLDAPAAPAKRFAFLGDSITQGFFASDTTKHWPALVCDMRNAQQGNLGYGGRICVPADGSAVQAWAPDAVVALIGVNDFNAQTPLATFETNHTTFQNNIRAALVAAGKPSALMVVMTMTWTNFPGAIPVEDYRQRVRNAVAARADPYTVLLEGATGPMPTTTTYFPDGIHPNDAGNTLIANVVSALLP
jgi:lysophospholipase L1-like esterase